MHCLYSCVMGWSSDLFSDDMFVWVRSGMLFIHRNHALLHRHLSVEALCFLIKLGGILRKMMDSYGTT